jgi:hypothetical protein
MVLEFVRLSLEEEEERGGAAKLLSSATEAARGEYYCF